MQGWHLVYQLDGRQIDSPTTPVCMLFLGKMLNPKMAIHPSVYMNVRKGTYIKNHICVCGCSKNTFECYIGAEKHHIWGAKRREWRSVQSIMRSSRAV